jgi:Histidine kinase-, DNA gyrase B-, and HSP90-like ATPase
MMKSCKERHLGGGNMAKLFNVTPKPAGLRSVQNENWNMAGALSEILDNSFGPARGNANSVRIFHDTKARILSVLDDGRGMDAIGRLFQHGNTIGRAIGDIGFYGAGGTKAILWMASRVQIWTLRDGMVQHDSVEWKEWMETESFAELGVSDDWKHATLANTPEALLVLGHGTFIKLHLPPRRRFHVHHVFAQLSKTYSTGLRRGKRITWVNVRRNEVSDEKPLSDPFLQPSEKSKTIRFDIVIEYEDKHLPVSGRVHHDESTPASESCIQIGYGFRIIRTARECYQSRDGEEKYVGTGVSGWLDLGENWQPYLSTTKDAFDDVPLFDILMGHVFEQIKPLLKAAEDQSFDVLFEDLNINLERALNGVGEIMEDATIKPIKVKPEPNPFPNPNPQSDRGPVPDPIESKRPVAEPDGKDSTKEPAMTRTITVPTNDVQMEGQLCRAQIDGAGVMVLVNKDHHAVQKALKQKPINRLALLLMVVHEISEAICALDESAAFIRKMFSRQVATSLNDLQSPRDRARRMARLLIDRARDRGEHLADAA